MTRLRKRGTAARRKERPSFADYILTRCLKALHTAMADSMADGGDIEAKIAERVVEGVLQDPKVLARVKSLKELQELASEMPKIMRELEAEQAKPPSLLIPQRPDKMNIAAPALHAMMTEASAAVINAADVALAESAADDKDPPTQGELAAWLAAANVSGETLAEVAKRLEVLWGLAPGKVRVAGWAFGGLVTWRDGVMFHAPAAELVATSKKKEVPNPLAPLVQAYPVVTEPGRHARPIVPAVFVQTQQPPLFHLPAPELPGHTTLGDTAYLPGLEPEAPPAPALLLAMFDAAGGASLTQNGRVSAAASIWLEAMLDLPPASRDGTLRETRYPIREIAGEWLGWNLSNYRTTGENDRPSPGPRFAGRAGPVGSDERPRRRILPRHGVRMERLEPGRPLRIRCPAATRPRRPADRPQAVTQPAGLRPRLSPLPEPVLRVGQVRRSQRQADTTHAARSPPGLRRAGPGRRRPDSHGARQSADIHAARQAGHLDRRTGAEPGQEPLPGVHTGRPGSHGLPRPGVQTHTGGNPASCSCSPTSVGDGGRRRRVDGYDSPSDIQAHAARPGSPAARVSRVVIGCDAARPLIFWYFSNASGSSAPKARRPLMALPTPCRAVGLVGGEFCACIDGLRENFVTPNHGFRHTQSRVSSHPVTNSEASAGSW